MCKPLVVIPTIKERETLCFHTKKQWELLGYDARIFCQSDAQFCSPQQHGKTALTALRNTHKSSDTAIIFCEDDVLIDKRIIELEIPREVLVLTFYLAGRSFYPRRLLTTPCVDPELFQITNSKKWFGSQCLWLSPSVIQGLLAENHQPHGFDELLKAYLIKHTISMYSVIPNLVQHLSPPSVTSKRYHPHKSITFEATNSCEK